GIAGLLASPGKGLFVFSPFLLFLGGLRRSCFSPGPERRLAAALGLGVVAQVVMLGATDFRAGWCYGPRFLVDALPILVFLLAPPVEGLAGPLRSVSVAFVAFSIGVQIVGVFCYPRGASDPRLYPGVWKVANTPFLVEARAGLAPPVFLETLI